MIFCNLFIFLFGISYSLWSTHALHAEHVFGGFNGQQRHFKYYVHVLKKESPNSLQKATCGAAFLRKDLFLSVASCFINSNGNIKPDAFYIAAGTMDLREGDGITVWIREIYVPEPTGPHGGIDAAVGKLDDDSEISFEPSSLFSALGLPISSTQFDGATAFLSGCECSPETTDISLKFIQVKILKQSEVGNIFTNSMDIRGQKLGSFTLPNFGLCEVDLGSPLVVGTKVVGINVGLYRDEGVRLVLYIDTYRVSRFIELAKQYPRNTDPIKVEILKESVCQGLAFKEKYESMQHKKSKLARLTSEYFGLSKADAGSPLVVGETVIGVAIEIYSEEASLDNLVSYTDVYRNSEFIELAKQVSPNPEYVFRFRNEVPST